MKRPGKRIGVFMKLPISDFGRHRSKITASFCRSFLERIEEEIYHQPENGLMLARRGIRICRLGAQDLLPWAIGLLSTVRRRSGRLKDALRLQNLALRFCEGGKYKANVLCRMATVQRDLGCLTAAFGLAREAIRIERTDRTCMTLGHMFFANCEYDKAFEIWLEGLKLAKPNSIFHEGCQINMVGAFCLSPGVDKLRSAMRGIRIALRKFREVRNYLDVRARLIWIKAMLCHRAGATAIAWIYYRQALEYFKKSRQPVEVASIMADMAPLAWDDGGQDAVLKLLNSVKGLSFSQAVAKELNALVNCLTSQLALYAQAWAVRNVAGGMKSLVLFEPAPEGCRESGYTLGMSADCATTTEHEGFAKRWLKFGSLEASVDKAEAARRSELPATLWAAPSSL